MLIELMLKSIMIVNKNIFSRELWKWVLISSVEISPFVVYNYNPSEYFRLRSLDLARGNIREYSLIFKTAHCHKDLKDNKHDSLRLGRKYARIFVLEHYLFLIAHSFPS